MTESESETPFADALSLRMQGLEAAADVAWEQGVAKFKRQHPDQEPPVKPWGDKYEFRPGGLRL